ncbi:hypothetical protein ACQY0O_001332 [Thecaphora frezii]
MQFSTVLVTLAAVATFVAANKGAGQCSNGKVQCCSEVHEGTDANTALAGLGLAANDVIKGAIGLNCNSIDLIIGVDLQNQCKSTPVCCQGSANNGLIQTSCTPISVL